MTQANSVWRSLHFPLARGTKFISIKFWIWHTLARRVFTLFDAFVFVEQQLCIPSIPLENRKTMYCVLVCGWCDRLLSVIFHICLVLFYLLCTSLAVPSSRSIESTEQTNAKAHVRERACTQFCCLEPNISYRDVNVYWLCRIKQTTDDCNCAVHYF